MTSLLLACAVAVVVGNVGVLILLFIERPEDRDRWR